ncbi:hypothetical protein BC834DRAFT_890058 [Gloeopeniophorella convolvens]|nr:hypothetical protein BC834DRAFT_890058 [Gloeopeniophorella convolvens]
MARLTPSTENKKESRKCAASPDAVPNLCRTVATEHVCLAGGLVLPRVLPPVRCCCARVHVGHGLSARRLCIRRGDCTRRIVGGRLRQAMDLGVSPARPYTLLLLLPNTGARYINPALFFPCLQLESHSHLPHQPPPWTPSPTSSPPPPPSRSRPRRPSTLRAAEAAPPPRCRASSIFTPSSSLCWFR